MTTQRQALGRRGEQLAIEVLRRRGMTILARNWRCRNGELDAVGLDGEQLVVIEVKARSSRRFGSAAEAVSDDKVRHLHELGWRFRREHDLPVEHIRVDVIAVDFLEDTPLIRYFRAVGS